MKLPGQTSQPTRQQVQLQDQHENQHSLQYTQLTGQQSRTGLPDRSSSPTMELGISNEDLNDDPGSPCPSPTPDSIVPVLTNESWTDVESTNKTLHQTLSPPRDQIYAH